MKRRSSEASLAMPSRRSLLGLIDDGDQAALATRLEHDGAGTLGEDRVVAADARAGARAEARAALADDDRARGDVLAGEDLHAEHLRVRVAAVPRGPESLFMGHLAVLPRVERRERALALRV